MPRYLPLLTDEFETESEKLLRFARRLEVNFASYQIPNARITQAGLELSYELIFLKIYLLWEALLEDIFLRLMNGMASVGGVEAFVDGVSRFPSLGAARTELLGASNFLLWYDPDVIVGRANRYFKPAPGYFRQVILANNANLRRYSRVRHRIAHAQQHAKDQFDQATMDMAGRRYPGSAAGRFLRDVQNADGRRWLEAITSDFADIGHQFC